MQNIKVGRAYVRKLLYYKEVRKFMGEGDKDVSYTNGINKQSSKGVRQGLGNNKLFNSYLLGFNGSSGGFKDKRGVVKSFIGNFKSSKFR